jgi:hypothetical protein
VLLAIGADGVSVDIWGWGKTQPALFVKSRRQLQEAFAKAFPNSTAAFEEVHGCKVSRSATPSNNAMQLTKGGWMRMETFSSARSS